MDVRNVAVPLDGRERSALAQLAEREMRGLRDQARFVIRQALMERGLLKPEGDQARPGGNAMDAQQ